MSVLNETSDVVFTFHADIHAFQIITMLWPEANRQKGFDIDFNLSQVYNLTYIYHDSLSLDTLQVLDTVLTACVPRIFSRLKCLPQYAIFLDFDRT
jgi:hypothetical protein